MVRIAGSIARRVVLLCAAATIVGCAGAEQVDPENPVGAGGLVPTQEDKDVGVVGIRDGFRLSDYRIVAVERLTVSPGELEDEGDRRYAASMAKFFQGELVRRIRETGLFDSVVAVTDSVPPPHSERTLVLQGTITRLGRGSEALRILYGAYGAGRSRAQVEMYFVDAPSGEVRLVIADRRVNRVGGDESSLRESFHDIAKDLGKFLVRLSKGQAPGQVG